MSRIKTWVNFYKKYYPQYREKITHADLFLKEKVFKSDNYNLKNQNDVFALFNLNKNNRKGRKARKHNIIFVCEENHGYEQAIFIITEKCGELFGLYIDDPVKDYYRYSETAFEGQWSPSELNYYLQIFLKGMHMPPKIKIELKNFLKIN